MSLRACYAMSGTHIAYGALSLRACNAMSGNVKAYQPMRLLHDARWICRGRERCGFLLYAMSSTDLAYGAISLCDTQCAAQPAFGCGTRCPVLTERMVLPGLGNRMIQITSTLLRYAARRNVWCYAMSSTELAYGAASAMMTNRAFLIW
eukprot:3773819-Rhodomonas_salina.1